MFNLTGVQTLDFQIMNSTCHALRRRHLLTTRPSRTTLLYPLYPVCEKFLCFLPLTGYTLHPVHVAYIESPFRQMPKPKQCLQFVSFCNIYFFALWFFLLHTCLLALWLLEHGLPTFCLLLVKGNLHQKHAAKLKLRWLLIHFDTQYGISKLREGFGCWYHHREWRQG